jgi:RNA polymerase sigma factor (sigma-70 family)
MSPTGTAAFPVTQHSLVHRLRDPDDACRTAAFDTLVRAYWAPIYTYLRLHWREPSADAQDLTQRFLASAWERGFLAKFDASKARFRTFLRVCLDRYVLNARRADAAIKRSAAAPLVPLDTSEVERALSARVPPPDADLDAFFHEEFVRALMARTVARLEADCRQRNRPAVYEVFAAYDLAGDVRPRYAEVATALGIPVTQVTNHLHAARRRFRELALDELRELCTTDDEFRDEAMALFGIRVS